MSLSRTKSKEDYSATRIVSVGAFHPAGRPPLLRNPPRPQTVAQQFVGCKTCKGRRCVGRCRF
jgi:hypothetical protein